MRLTDQLSVLDKFLGAAVEHQADMGIIAGDLFHQRNPHPLALAGVARFARAWSVTVGAPLIIVPGNHDGMSVVGNAESHTLGWLEVLRVPHVHVLTQPTAKRIGGARIVAFPYPHKRGFDQIAPDLSPEERMVEIGRAVQQQIVEHLSIAEFAERLDDDSPIIFIGHLSVAGSVIASERTMRFGWDVMVGAEAFEGFDYAALGHIHVAQNIGPKAYYPGSPEYIDFGEAGQPKGFLLVEVERGKDPVVKRLDSEPRPMVVLDHPGPPITVPDGAIVRVLLAPGQIVDLPQSVAYVEYRYDLPERPDTMPDRAIDADMDWESALRHWLKINGHEEWYETPSGRRSYLDAARDLVTAP
jgi:exonuclease SbcD